MTMLSRLAGAWLQLPKPHTTHVHVERDLAVPMPDGIVLYADRWHTGAHDPIVLVRTPYGRRIMNIVGRLIAERGFQVVIQSCRGTFGSQGGFTPFRNEAADGRA